VQTISAEVLRTFFGRFVHLQPATRARKQAAVARFLTWAEQQDLLDSNPMRKIDRVKPDPPQPRGMERDRIERILKTIPAKCLRDQLFLRLLLETGLRVGEGLSLYVEDLDLSLGNEHLTVVGNGGKRRTVLLDDPRLVQQLRAYLKRTGYKHGPLFRAEKNGRGGSLRYQSMQQRWDHYCSQADIVCTLHQLRHSHATELINGGVSLPTIRKRLGIKIYKQHFAMQSKLMKPLMRKYAHGAVSVFPCKKDRDRSINLSTGAYPRLPQEVQNEQPEIVFWERRC
jgi:integrase/recombinase XerD